MHVHRSYYAALHSCITISLELTDDSPKNLLGIFDMQDFSGPPNPRSIKSSDGSTALDNNIPSTLIMTKYENANKINFNFAFQNQIPVYYIKEQNKNDNSCLQTSSCHVKFNFFVKTTIYKKIIYLKYKNQIHWE